MFTLADIEGEARWLLQHADHDDAAPPAIAEVARIVTGHPVETVPRHSLRGDGQLARLRGEPRVYVRSGLTQERLRWAIAHELGHLVLGLDNSSSENEEACDAFAASLLLPRRAFLKALARSGGRYQQLARWFASTESCAALRVGEVTGAPTVLLAPGRIRFRGDDFVWPPSMRGPGILRTKIKDAPGRAVVTLDSSPSALPK